jgi:hypothetical protein
MLVRRRRRVIVELRVPFGNRRDQEVVKQEVWEQQRIGVWERAILLSGDMCQLISWPLFNVNLLP